MTTLQYEPRSLPGIASLSAARKRRVGAGVVRYVGVSPSQPGAGVFSQTQPVAPTMVEQITLVDGTLLHDHHRDARAVEGTSTV